MFRRLKRTEMRLYRGSNGRAARVIMQHAGVGPIRDVARLIARDNTLIPPQEKPDVGSFLLRRIHVTEWTQAGLPLHWVDIPPNMTMEDQLDSVLDLTNIVGNHMTPFEHVVKEEQVNTPSTARLLESVSRDPRIAILYAYAATIDPYPRADWNDLVFASTGPNREAFVAILHPETELPLANPPDVNLAVHMYGLDECRRRIRRDSEVLLNRAMEAAGIVPLPPLDTTDPEQSLNLAASALITAGFATA